MDKDFIVSVTGLGYVGLPLAIEFSKKVQVIGYDRSEEKIQLYRSGVDPTNEVGDEAVKNSRVLFTSDPKQLDHANFHIIAVPTPVNQAKVPDLTAMKETSATIGKHISKGDLVVYESTVYPGVTEEVCIPILEQESGFTCGVDFGVGYSPERINPSDKIHNLPNIIKIVSGCNEETMLKIKEVYEMIIEAGTLPVSSIKTAEAIKIAENSQRDINIAFMNELAMVFDRMGVDTNEVIDGMNTKWNALGFRPGLVGGHCIGVDPYYFVYKSEQLGYHSQIISTARKINDDMGRFIVDSTIKLLVEAKKAPAKAKVAILGLTFKENCPDCRNSKVADVIERFKEYTIDPIVVDPWAPKEEAKKIYGITLSELEDVKDMDCVVLAVAHDQFKEIGKEKISRLFSEERKPGVFIDVKGVFNRTDFEEDDLLYWRL